MNEIIVFESLRFCPTKAKSRLLQRNSTLGTVFESPHFWCPTILLVESKMEKENLRISVDRALINICYETKSRNLKC